jgi:plastocyanin
VPGEVSVPAGGTCLTFYELDEPGTYDVVCHLPRHAAYGMVATVRVVRD